MSTDDKLMDRIAALLRKAEDPGATEAEAEIFLAKAMEMIAKHQLDESEIRERNGQQEETGYFTNDSVLLKIRAEHAAAAEHLLISCTKALGVIVTGKRYAADNRFWEIHLAGRETDVQLLKVLWTSILAQMQIARSRAIRKDFKGETSRHIFVQSFYLSYAHVTSDRVMEFHTVVADESAAATLVWAGAGSAIETVTKARKHDPTGYRSGAAAGALADVSGGSRNVSKARGTRGLGAG